jgi:branched-chain amino acid transport system permease protein/neutral amino acid transport system permease protein
VSIFVAAVGFGLASGAVIALASLGFTLQFGLSNTLNIGYGGFITMAAFLGYGLIQLGLGPWTTMAAIAATTGLASVLYYRLFIRSLIRRSIGLGPLAIATAAALIFIEYAVVAVAGTDVKSYGLTSGHTFHLWYFVWSSTQVVIIILALVLMAAFQALLRFTQLGRALRATAVNRTLARSCGIRAERVTATAWLISGLLCGIAGVALAITTQAFDFNIGSNFLILIIAAAVVGGIGEPYGAIAGGFLIGITTEISAAYWSPAYSDVIAFALLIAILLVRPTGLLGGQARRRNVAT